MLGTIVGLIIIGIVAGYVARLLVPGRDSMGVGATILLGIVGSFIGGFLGFLLFHKDSSAGFVQPSSWIGSIIGAVIALLVYNAVSGRSSNRAGALRS
jgi:uncharacterized membrane protein YeaQ/YmgE (transglycosylase-associated protein family)